MSRVQHEYIVSDIRTQLIVLDARFHLLGGSLQVLPYLETDPYFEHGRVALADTFEQRSTAALGTELAQDWESAAERVSMLLKNGKCESIM